MKSDFLLFGLTVVALGAHAFPFPSFIKRAVLADGSSMQTGQINDGLRWQSSGRLETGCGGRISNCYTLSLASSGQLASRQLLESQDTAPNMGAQIADIASDLATTNDLPLSLTPNSEALLNSTDIDTILAYSSPRQRIEFLSWPPAPAGSTFRYTWSTYLQSPISTGKQFFHLWQLFSREEGGPIVSLTATNGRVAIDDNIREGCGGSCPSIALGAYTDKVVKHDLKVTFGKEGSLSYTMTDAGAGQALLRYTAKGDMGQDSSLKFTYFGLYRATYSGMSAARAYIGAYSARQL